MKTRQASNRATKSQQEVDVEPPLPRRRGKKPRHRNQCGDEVKINKWTNYRKVIHRHILNLTRDEHFCNTLSVQRSSNSIMLLGQLQHYGDKIRQSKLAILQTLNELESENASDKRYPSLAISDENGMVNLECINCSKCDGVDTEGDDIVFCDREGCCRAYHQSCLDPPLQADLMNFDDPDEDWLCWQCECIEDCLGMVNDMCDCEATSVDMLFPELNQPEAIDEDSSMNIEQEDDDDDEDDDYTSQCEEDDSQTGSNVEDGESEDNINQSGTDNESEEGDGDDDSDDDSWDRDCLDNTLLSIDEDEVMHTLYTSHWIITYCCGNSSLLLARFDI